MSQITIHTTVRCCEEMHSTPFCPLCGRALAPEVPLIALLQHITSQSTRLRRQVSLIDPQSHGYDKYKRSAGKWESWRVALTEVVNRNKEGETDADN